MNDIDESTFIYDIAVFDTDEDRCKAMDALKKATEYAYDNCDDGLMDYEEIIEYAEALLGAEITVLGNILDIEVR